MQVTESEDARTPIGSDLAEGLKTISLDQDVEFWLYGRVVVPLDGFVFWVRSDMLSRQQFQQSGLVTAAALARDEERKVCFEARGSLHVTTDTRQEEAENYSANRVVFTSLEEVNPLNAVAPGTMWIAKVGDLRFAFSNSSMRYRQAGLWHYSGFAVYSDMLPQIIDRVQDFDASLVVSNSLPAWLAIAQYAPAWAFWGKLPPLFPSFAVPQNEAPPFASVHVLPEGTEALASAPTIDQSTSSHVQLCADTVRITLWGARNQQALGFIDCVNRYSLDRGTIGIMNIPVVRDEKRTQSELGTLSVKKTIDFRVSYLQSAMRTLGTQIIRTCIPTIIMGQ